MILFGDRATINASVVHLRPNQTFNTTTSNWPLFIYLPKLWESPCNSNKVYFQLLPCMLRGMWIFRLAQCNKNGTCVCHCANCSSGCQSCSTGWSGSTANFCQKGTYQFQSMRKTLLETNIQFSKWPNYRYKSTIKCLINTFMNNTIHRKYYETEGTFSIVICKYLGRQSSMGLWSPMVTPMFDCLRQSSMIWRAKVRWTLGDRRSSVVKTRFVKVFITCFSYVKVRMSAIN